VTSYVDPACNDGNSGAAIHASRLAARAISVAVAATTINLNPRTYAENTIRVFSNP
jgi:hypothetical protein